MPSFSLNKNSLVSIWKLVKNPGDRLPRLSHLSLLGNPLCPHPSFDLGGERPSKAPADATKDEIGNSLRDETHGEEEEEEKSFCFLDHRAQRPDAHSLVDREREYRR